MNEFENIESRLKECRRFLEEYLQKSEENREDLNRYYLETHRDEVVYDSEGRQIIYTCTGFDKLFEDNRTYINKQIEFMLQIIDLKIIEKNKFSRQMKAFVSECIGRMEQELRFDYDKHLIYEIIQKTDFSQEYSSILILSKFSAVEENIVLIGGNGSGKSSLAKTLKGNDRENISVIPAQKTLYFSLNDMSMLSTRLKDLEELLLENNINKSKMKNDYEYFNYQNNQFTKLIVAMREQYTEYLMECEENSIVAQKENSIFGRIRNIFSVMFPEIKLHFKSDTSDYLTCEKDDEYYHVNALSEGEKAVIYYSISVLMAKQESFIVVDEPETYLNPSLTNILWDLLIKERSDCQFIFITHSVDFVLGRSEAKVAWIKQFEYPDNWEFEFIENNFLLPKTMLTEILGSKKPVMFCEGDDKSSLDYTIYRALLGENYTIIPVGGHLDVIKYCDVMSKSVWLSMECVGLIDGDNHSTDKKDLLKDRGVEILPFNEIEMFLLSDEVLSHTMKIILPLEAQSRIEKFKNQFWNLIVNKKENIVLMNTKIIVDEHIQKQRIEEFGSVSDIEENISKIAECNVQEIYENNLSRISEIIEKRDYEKLLVVCNLKKEISRGLANQYLDKDYETKAVQQIVTNHALKEDLLNKYFEFVHKSN